MCFHSIYPEARSCGFAFLSRVTDSWTPLALLYLFLFLLHFGVWWTSFHFFLSGLNVYKWVWLHEDESKEKVDIKTKGENMHTQLIHYLTPFSITKNKKICLVLNLRDLISVFGCIVLLHSNIRVLCACPGHLDLDWWSYMNICREIYPL